MAAFFSGWTNNPPTRMSASRGSPAAISWAAAAPVQSRRVIIRKNAFLMSDPPLLYEPAAAAGRRKVGAVDLGMAVGAPGIERPLGFRGRGPADPVARVALQAEERLPKRQEPAVDRPVGHVAGSAVLGKVRVLVHEGPRFLDVALGAGFLHRRAPEVLLRVPAVGVVAVEAEDLLLRHRVVGGEREGRLDVGMALVAQAGHIAGLHLQV